MKRPDSRQLAEMYDELHDLVDTLVFAYARAEEVRVDYARDGLKSSSGGAGGHSGISDPTFAIATQTGPDPAAVAEKLLAQIVGWRHHGRIAATTWAGLEKETRPLTKTEIEDLAKRRNTVDVCALCHQPNPKMKRINGQPYCATSCYFRQWRSSREDSSRATGATG